MAGVYQMYGEIEGIKPKIWRRFKVNDSYTLFDLGNVINYMFDWLGMHLSEFRINDSSYGLVELEASFESDMKDSRKFRLRDLDLKKGMKFTYIYDFGDWWEHIITVENHEKDAGLIHPICLDGERNGPPEDCGGIPGYYNLIEVLEYKNHPDRELYKEFIDDEWDPEDFDVELLNFLIRDPEIGFEIDPNGGKNE